MPWGKFLYNNNHVNYIVVGQMNLKSVRLLIALAFQENI